MSWEKISDKQYSIRLNNTLTDIFVPYAKADSLFRAFVSSGGVISEDGVVQNDIISLISNFSVVGNILLSTYGPRGEVLTEGDCSELSVGEVIEVFKVATDIVENFIKCIGEMQAAPVQEETPEPQKKTKKTA